MAGTTVVALRGSRHAADPSEFTDEELAGYRSDVRTIARAIERAYDPGQLNYMTFGNTPHARVIGRCSTTSPPSFFKLWGGT